MTETPIIGKVLRSAMKRYNLVNIRCQECGTQVATVANGVLLIHSRHHGRHHEVVVAIADLVALLDKEKLLV